MTPDLAATISRSQNDEGCRFNTRPLRLIHQSIPEQHPDLHLGFDHHFLPIPPVLHWQSRGSVYKVCWLFSFLLIAHFQQFSDYSTFLCRRSLWFAYLSMSSCFVIAGNKNTSAITVYLQAVFGATLGTSQQLKTIERRRGYGEQTLRTIH